MVYLKFIIDHIENSYRMVSDVFSEQNGNAVEDWEDELDNDSIIKWNSQSIGLIGVDENNAVLSCNQLHSLNNQASEIYPGFAVNADSFQEET